MFKISREIKNKNIKIQISKLCKYCKKVLNKKCNCSLFKNYNDLVDINGSYNETLKKIKMYHLTL